MLDTSLTIGGAFFLRIGIESVVDSIKEAYTNRVQIAPNKYIGQTSSGFKVEMIIENGEITTAYPKYTRR